MANGWTAERRQRQAEMIRNWQPWQNSTGAKTAVGKAISSGNAFKGGLRSELRKLSKALREQRQAIEALW